jgi:hypothetical protein
MGINEHCRICGAIPGEPCTYRDSPDKEGLPRPTPHLVRGWTDEDLGRDRG